MAGCIYDRAFLLDVGFHRLFLSFPSFLPLWVLERRRQLDTWKIVGGQLMPGGQLRGPGTNQRKRKSDSDVVWRLELIL